jgi:hypothetical protein
VDTNGMTRPWIDYHIRAMDFTTTANPGSEISHLSVAHFHTPNAFSSGPLALSSDGDNVTKLDFGLGSQVNPGANFTASNILLHERDYSDVARSFRVEFAPSVPEPSTFVLFLGMGAIAGLGRWQRKAGTGAQVANSKARTDSFHPCRHTG